MSEKKRNCSNEAVEKIIGNITSEMQTDGQYVPLGFTPPPNEPPINWTQPPNPHLNHYYVPNQDLNYNSLQFSQFNYIQPLFNPIYNKNYDMYQNGDLFDGGDYRLLMPQTPPQHFSEPPPASNQIIENLVGNWVPNTSGTYSPFGNVEPFGAVVFDHPPEVGTVIGEPIEEKQFQFNRSTKKPRMVAEVKPMRPSYSDVLTKPVPQSKVAKIDLKEAKQKKDTKKNSKNDKENKKSIINNRSNTNETKEFQTDKTQFNKTNEKFEKTHKTSQLNRKWASLDNISEPLNNTSRIEDQKKRKSEDIVNKIQKPIKKTNKNNETNEDLTGKNESLSVSKNGIKIKGNKFNGRQKNSEVFERPSGKRNQRARKRENQMPFGVVGQKLKLYLKGWWKYLTVFLLWLVNLISDVCSLSVHISRDLACNFWTWFCIHWFLFLDTSLAIIKRIKLLTWLWEKLKGKETKSKTNNNNKESRFVKNGLKTNITMPLTGDEAMKRLLACKGKDPYSILGVIPTCTDEDIKKYYKRQAFLVHPDKNQQPGAEEAFKILVHAFDMIGEPERRAAYDKGVVESVQVEQAWSELTELLAQLQQKVEAAANTIRCSACGLRHKRVKLDRPCYAARNCVSCKIHHAAREGDIWAEARCFGFLWHYYACMEGGVYDITDWAGCQKDSLKHLRPDSHQVQYRIALGKQHQQQQTNNGRHSGSPRNNNNERPPDLENLLNTLYGQGDMASGRRRNKKK